MKKSWYTVLNSLLTALDKDSELGFQQRLPLRWLSVFQVINCLTERKQAELFRGSSNSLFFPRNVSHPLLSFPYSEFPQYLQIPRGQGQSHPFPPLVDTCCCQCCTKRNSWWDSASQELPLHGWLHGGPIKLSLNWWPLVLFPFWYKTQVRKQKNVWFVFPSLKKNE